ncbi:MAG: NADPH-dependent glutamate synthase [Candidatus Omnitrophica bacterium]|nr:NADPH-dependent glutamate synthase [Candidatus Omnitrophota bacterium]
MNEIVEKKKIAESTYLIRVKAPEIALARKTGQFVIFRIEEEGERIPLTIADTNLKEGTITIIFQEMGKSTRQLGKLGEGDFILDVAGPLGQPTHIEKFGKVVCLGCGLGIALIWPMARALKEAGNQVTSILSARTKDLIILEDEMRKISNRLEIATDDGSKGLKGYPTQILAKMLSEGKKFDIAFCVGPVPAMQAVCNTTKPFALKTIVSLNPIIVDGTGMCGSCRVTVGDETRFVCVDGPEFDGHLVDFRELQQRMTIYEQEPEKRRTTQYIHRAGLCDVAIQEAADNEKRLPRQPMPEQDPKERIRNFEEVPYGYTPEQAKAEASRCLQCKKPLCIEGCPVNIKIPEFIRLIAHGQFIEAAEKLKEDNSLPAICGRVCPQETQCEEKCIVGQRGDPVAIGHLERFAADYEREHGKIKIPRPASPTGKKVAIIGAGPAGLTAAGDLAKLGHKVTIFEAFHKTGGVLTYGIPEYRLPKDIVEAEVDYVKKLGVEIKLNTIIGKVLSIDDLLKQGFDAVFLGTGAGLPLFLGIPGENLNGVMSANEYLTRTNLMKAYDPKYETPILKRDRIAVIGGGNVAMDTARTALRLGAKKVFLVYRRSREEMPARREEIHHGEDEGILFQFLTNPVRILGNDQGWVKGLECQRMGLGEPDASGRKRPIPVSNSEFVLDVEMVIVAIGNGPHPIALQSAPDIQTTDRGNIIVENESGLTSKPFVYAGGDIVSGAATVIAAMGAGRRAAEAIHQQLMPESSG